MNGAVPTAGVPIRLLGEVLTAAAAAGGAVALVAGRPTLGLVTILLALAGLVALVLQVPGPPDGSPLGVAIVSRCLITAGCALALAEVDRPGQLLPVLLASASLIGGLAAEGLLSRIARYRVPVMANLAGLEPPRPAPRLDRVVVLAGLAAILLGVGLAMAGQSAWWWLATAVVAEIPAVGVVWFGRVSRQRGARLTDQLPAEIARYGPTFVVYTSRPDDASYQVTMWLPYLKRSGLPFVVVTRSAEPAAALARLTDVPVIEARSLKLLESIVVPSLRAAFYVNASSGNGSLIRYSHLRHVYLGHGDSDKAPSYNPTHAMYDEIFAAGAAAIRRYADHDVRIPAEKFRIVGRPQVEQVRPAATPIAKVAQPTVLYAPTWRGHVEETLLYSLPVGETIVRALLDRGATVIFRPHPFSYDFPADVELVRRIQQLLAADKRASGRPHVWGQPAEIDRSILECINEADAMISDVSSVVSDFLFSGKPMAMVAVPAEPDRFVAEYPIARAAYVLRGDLRNIGPVLDEMLGPDEMIGRRDAVRSDYLGDFPAEDYASAFVDAVRAATEVPPATAVVERVGNEPTAALVGTRRWLTQAGRMMLQIGPAAGATLLAIAALGVAAAGGSLTVTTTLIALTLALLVRPVRMVLQSPHRAARRGVAEPARATLVMVIVAVGASEGSPAALTALVITLAAVLALETHVQDAYAEYAANVRNLPALAPGGISSPPALLAVSHLLALAAALVLVWTGRTGWIVPVTVALVAVAGVALARAPITPRRAERTAGRLREELTRYAPEFAVYFSSTVGAGYQVGMWLPYFIRIGRPFIVLVRTAPMLNEIAAAVRDAGAAVPVIFRPSLRSLEEVIVPSLKVAFYVNNAARNTHFIERRELTHVWLNHGDSEKPACYNPVHAIYDLIFVAGQAGIDRYARHGVHIPAEKFRIVGRPQVEQITRATTPITNLTAPTVLYAPTWQGPYADSRLYSLPIGLQIVEHALTRGARVIFRAHPFNYRYAEARAMITEIGALLDADRAEMGREHLWGPAAEVAMSVEDCFNISDAMVADVSAVVSDYLQSGKPYAMVSVGRTPEELVVEAPAARAAYVLREDLSNLVDVFDDLLSADPLSAERHQTKIYYLGDFPDENYADGFLNAAREVIAGRKARMTT